MFLNEMIEAVEIIYLMSTKALLHPKSFVHINNIHSHTEMISLVWHGNFSTHCRAARYVSRVASYEVIRFLHQVRY